MKWHAHTGSAAPFLLLIHPAVDPLTQKLAWPLCRAYSLIMYTSISRSGIDADARLPPDLVGSQFGSQGTGARTYVLLCDRR